MFSKHPKRLSRLLLGGELGPHQEKALRYFSEYNLLVGLGKELGIGERVLGLPASKVEVFSKIYSISNKLQEKEKDATAK